MGSWNKSLQFGVLLSGAEEILPFPYTEDFKKQTKLFKEYII